MPLGMWVLFHASFQDRLTKEFGLSAEEAGTVAARAKIDYKKIIADLPEFEKEDRFQMNAVNCAMLAAFILNMPRRPDVDTLQRYYAEAMMTPAMKWFCRKSGKQQFSDKKIEGLKAAAKLRAADRNPYSWNMDCSGFESRFTRCGICEIMKKFGLYDLTPALCHLDYTMAETGGTTDFVREYTLASGGPYCDCGYHKKK